MPSCLVPSVRLLQPSGLRERAYQTPTTLRSTAYCMSRQNEMGKVSLSSALFLLEVDTFQSITVYPISLFAATSNPALPRLDIHDPIVPFSRSGMVGCAMARLLMSCTVAFAMILCLDFPRDPLAIQRHGSMSCDALPFQCIPFKDL